MKTDKFDQIIYDESDVIDIVMRGETIPAGMLLDPIPDLENASLILDNLPSFLNYNEYAGGDLSQAQFDHRCQNNWFMPQEYRDLDIAKHILDLCQTETELQRVGQELLLYQERDLFDLLRYLKYLVDVLRKNNCIWGVGRGSSVASYVLYLLGVHSIDSIYYDLDPAEFLR